MKSGTPLALGVVTALVAGAAIGRRRGGSANYDPDEFAERIYLEFRKFRGQRWYLASLPAAYSKWSPAFCYSTGSLEWYYDPTPAEQGDETVLLYATPYWEDAVDVIPVQLDAGDDGTWAALAFSVEWTGDYDRDVHIYLQALAPTLDAVLTIAKAGLRYDVVSLLSAIDDTYGPPEIPAAAQRNYDQLLRDSPPEIKRALLVLGLHAGLVDQRTLLGGRTVWRFNNRLITPQERALIPSLLT